MAARDQTTARQRDDPSGLWIFRRHILDRHAERCGIRVDLDGVALRHLDRIAARLIAAGRAPAEPVAVVSRATLPDQRVIETTLGEAATAVAAA